MNGKSSRASVDSVSYKSRESEKRHGSSKNQSAESTKKRKHGKEIIGQVMIQDFVRRDPLSPKSSLGFCSVEEVKLPRTTTSKMIRRISAIMEEAESSVTMDHIMEKYKNLNTLGYLIRTL